MCYPTCELTYFPLKRKSKCLQSMKTEPISKHMFPTPADKASHQPSLQAQKLQVSPWRHTCRGSHLIHAEQHQVRSAAARDPTRRTAGFWGALTALCALLETFNTVLRPMTPSLQPGRSELWLQASEKAVGCSQTCFVHRVRVKDPQPHPAPAHPGVCRRIPQLPATPKGRSPKAPGRGNPAKLRAGREGSPTTYPETILPLRISAGAMVRAGGRASSGPAEVSAARLRGTLRDALRPPPPHSRPTWPELPAAPTPAPPRKRCPRPAPPRLPLEGGGTGAAPRPAPPLLPRRGRRD